MEEIINKLSIDIDPIICDGIEEKDWSIVRKEYNRILHNRYSEIDQKLNTDDYEYLYNSLYESEYEEWSNISLPMKKNLLIPDLALEDIIDISNKSFEYAKEKFLHGKFITEEIADAYITKLNSFFTQVYDHNKTQANWNIKEATIDLMYASNQSDNVSTRISHLI